MRRSASSVLISTQRAMDLSSKTSKLPSHGLFTDSMIHSLSLPFLPHPTQLPPTRSSTSKTSTGRPACCFYTSSFLAICFILYLIWFSSSFQVSKSHVNVKSKGYIIIIDAGSSGSRAHVFHYVNDGSIPLMSLSRNEVSSLKTKPGLSSFADNPQNAGESLAQLIVFASSKVPERARRSTGIYLMATAGLRRLDPAIQKAILESCRVVLRASGFRFQVQWASVITGLDEGVYAWMSANYALGRLGRSPEDTVGIIELGGASAQITFVPETPPPPQFLHTINLGGVTYSLYTHSFLNLGQEAAWDGLVQSLLSKSIQSSSLSAGGGVFDPCTPRGFGINSEAQAHLSATSLDRKLVDVPTLVPRGNFSECRDLAVQLLQVGQDQCLYQNCAIASTYVPKLRGKFFATENFFYTSQFFGLVPKATLVDIQHAGQSFCKENWKQLQQIYEGISDLDLQKYCFSSAYIVAFLHDRLGLGMNDDRVSFTNQVGKVSIDWALGAAIAKILEDGSPDTSSDVFDDYKTIFSFVSLPLVFGLAILLVYWWRRPNLKTIYDLEKGRYITTVARNLNKV